MTEPERPTPDPDALAPPTVRDVDYKGGPLDSERGPGLGCFWLQLAVLAVLLVLTPLSVAWGWPFWLSATLLVVVLLLLLLAGQTVIFLLRLVAADRRAAGRRRPLASTTRTVGEIEDEAENEVAADNEAGADNEDEAENEAAAGEAPSVDPRRDPTDPPGAPGGGVRE